MYYSNEALNPRPKRGRPPKQAAKPDIEPQVTLDLYTTIVPVVRPFLFAPEINPASAFSVFSAKFDSEEELLVSRRSSPEDAETSLSQKLASLRALSSKWIETPKAPVKGEEFLDDEMDEDDEDEEEDDFESLKSKSNPKLASKSKADSAKPKAKAPVIKQKIPKKSPAIIPKRPPKPEKPKAKRIMPRTVKEEANKKKDEGNKKGSKTLKKILPRKK